MLGGAAVVLFGVLGLLGFRLISLASNDDLVLDVSPITGASDHPSDSGLGDSGDDSPANGASPNAGSASQGSSSGGNDANSGTSIAASGDSSLANSSPLTSKERETQKRRILAEMETVHVKVQRLPDDLRGDVHRTVESSALGAMEACMLVCSDMSEASMNVEMEIRNTDGNDRLWLVAALTVGNVATDDVLWTHSADMGPITRQALETGIVPPNLRRDSNLLFTDLRAKFVSARREFGVRKPGKARTLHR